MLGAEAVDFSCGCRFWFLLVIRLNLKALQAYFLKDSENQMNNCDLFWRTTNDAGKKEREREMIFESPPPPPKKTRHSKE